jgi:hypothetical protein
MSSRYRRPSNPVLSIATTASLKAVPSTSLCLLNTTTESVTMSSPTTTLFTCPHCYFTSCYTLSDTQTSPACANCMRLFKEDRNEGELTSFPRLLKDYSIAEECEQQGHQEAGRWSSNVRKGWKGGREDVDVGSSSASWKSTSSMKSRVLRWFSV